MKYNEIGKLVKAIKIIKTNKNKIKCLECGKFLFYITHSHLKKCSDLTTFEYRKKYPNSNIYYKYTRFKYFN